MPEGIEVQIQTEGLLGRVLRQKIEKVSFHDKGEKIIRPIKKPDFKEIVEGELIDTIFRKGKYIVFRLRDDLFMVSHLAMTGRWTVNVPEEEIGYSKLTFELSGGDELRYSDVRIFGRVYLVSSLDLSIFKKGLDVLLAEEKDILKKLIDTRIKFHLRKKEINVKEVLTNQDILSGLGNVYANEVLFRSRLHPGRAVKSLTDKELKILARNVKGVLKWGYELGGLSLKDYFHVDGTKGEAQLYLNAYKNKRCHRCWRSSLEKSNDFDGRATYFCPRCQK